MCNVTKHFCTNFFPNPSTALWIPSSVQSSLSQTLYQSEESGNARIHSLVSPLIGDSLLFKYGIMISAGIQWLKMAWATHPVLVVACVAAALGKLCTKLAANWRALIKLSK